MRFSKRIMNMQSSPIRRLIPYAQKAEAAGRKVYKLNIGQPDIKTPPSFFDAIKAIDTEILAYGQSNGDLNLIRAMRKYYDSYGISFENDEILVSNGGSEALLFTMMALCDPGDHILVPEPFYANYRGFAAAIDASVKGITTKAEDGYHLPAKEEILALIDEHTRAIIFANPGNPTGTIYTEQELKMLAEIAKEKDIFLVADEVYREFVYDGAAYRSMATFPEVADRVIIVDSVSKRYSACGARIGCLASKNKDFIAEVLKICQGRLSVPMLEQVGATALYGTPASYFDEVKAEYKKRRDVTYEALQKMDGVICVKPQGAFYISIKLPVDDAEQFVIWALENFEHENQTIMFAPLEGFYATEGLGKDEARIAYILNAEDMKKAMEVLELALKAYPRRK